MFTEQCWVERESPVPGRERETRKKEQIAVNKERVEEKGILMDLLISRGSIEERRREEWGGGAFSEGRAIERQTA